MRRGLVISLILFFGLGPLAAALPDSGDSRLPACCRRHGAHRCAASVLMAAAMAEAASGTPTLSAPATCPCFPGYTAAPTTPSHALAPLAAAMPVLPEQAHSPAAGRAETRLGPIRALAGRGPPASIPA